MLADALQALYLQAFIIDAHMGRARSETREWVASFCGQGGDTRETIAQTGEVVTAHGKPYYNNGVIFWPRLISFVARTLLPSLFI